MDFATPSLTPAINCHEHALLEKDKPKPNAKKIFVFCDGTGNKFQVGNDQKGGSNSNVVKLYTTLRVADNQVAYYHPGVGTLGDPNIRWRIPRWWSMIKGLAFGAGFRDNVLDAYRYLMETYNDGDEIYIFGFSRGSYTARALAGLLHGYGLLCRGNESHLIYAWNAFHDELKRTRKLGKAKRSDNAAQSICSNFAFSETFSRSVTIRFMGLWDTVSSVGWIYKPLRLLDMARNPILRVGRHAVSIDEKRAFYRDNLWGPPFDINDKHWPAEFRDQGIKQDLAQVWFPGAHSDIGGSYPQDESAPANETLKWMIGELQHNGAQLCQERIDMVLGKESKLYSADAIYCPAPKPDHKLHNQLKGLWCLLQCFPQQYYDKDDKLTQWRVPYWTPRKIPNPSIIHGSAVVRLSRTLPGEKPYKPTNLREDLLKPAHPHFGGTAADLTGCSVYENTKKSVSDRWRYPKLIVGWITFGVFVGVFALGAFYFLRLMAYLFYFILMRFTLWSYLAACFHWLVFEIRSGWSILHRKW